MALESLSPSLVLEAQGSLERCLALIKAEALGAPLDRKKSTIYHWAGHPEEIPVSALRVLAERDPDPEFLARCAWHLLAASAEIAAKRGGRARVFIQEFAPGRWGRTS